jgi:hypothetical protein
MTEQEATLQLRSSALTTLALTAHPDLRVRRSALADATDKEVFFKVDGDAHPPRFVVHFHGEVKLAGQRQAERVAKRLFGALADEEHSCPLLLAVFSHADDRGWVCWVTKPTGDELVRQELPDCRPLDRAALDEIVAAVKAWRSTVVAGKRA